MLDNYKIHEQIGQGEYGKVYRATNLKDGSIVAVKMIDVQKFNDTPKLLELCMQEIEVLEKLQSCPYIVRFYELIKQPNQYYFIYEYCQGGPLDKLLLLQGHFTEQKSLKIIYQLLQAFKLMREHQIVHRDLKPSNILIHNGIYKLADFGFCKPIKNDVTATMLGSPIYMAPEVLRGLTYNSKADIWSLGAVLYELLIGKCPFEEKSIAKLITAQDETDWFIPGQFHFTKSTVNLLKSMLIKDPQKRCSWEFLFKIPLNQEGEFEQELQTHVEQQEQPIQIKIPVRVNILQEIVNERCKIQFICQTSNMILEQSLNEKSTQIAYYLLQLAFNRSQQFMLVLKNYQNAFDIREYPSLAKLACYLRQENDMRSLSSNFEFTRLVDTLTKEIDHLTNGILEYRNIFEPAKANDSRNIDISFDQLKIIGSAINQFINTVRSQNYMAFIDHKNDKDRGVVLHCVQILDALYVDKFMKNNIVFGFSKFSSRSLVPNLLKDIKYTRKGYRYNAYSSKKPKITSIDPNIPNAHLYYFQKEAVNKKLPVELDEILQILKNDKYLLNKDVRIFTGLKQLFKYHPEQIQQNFDYFEKAYHIVKGNLRYLDIFGINIFTKITIKYFNDDEESWRLLFQNIIKFILQHEHNQIPLLSEICPQEIQISFIQTLNKIIQKAEQYKFDYKYIRVHLDYLIRNHLRFQIHPQTTYNKWQNIKDVNNLALFLTDFTLIMQNRNDFFNDYDEQFKKNMLKDWITEGSKLIDQQFQQLKDTSKTHLQKLKGSQYAYEPLMQKL